MTEYKYLLCGYDHTIIHDPDHFVDVKLIGIYDNYENAYNIQKQLGIIQVKENYVKGLKYCTWIKKISLSEGTLVNALSLRSSNNTLT